MPLPHQIDEQIKHERAAIAQGLKRLKENTKRLEEKDYASASVHTFQVNFIDSQLFSKAMKYIYLGSFVDISLV